MDPEVLCRLVASIDFERTQFGSVFALFGPGPVVVYFGTVFALFGPVVAQFGPLRSVVLAVVQVAPAFAQFGSVRCVVQKVLDVLRPSLSPSKTDAMYRNHAAFSCGPLLVV